LPAVVAGVGEGLSGQELAASLQGSVSPLEHKKIPRCVLRIVGIKQEKEGGKRYKDE